TQPPVTQPPVTQPPVTQPPVVGDTVPNREIDPSKPMIALTFDDGPSAHTDRLLDIFAQYGAKGTFFVVGDLIDNRPSTVVRIVQEGHDIGGHGWSHKKLTTITEEEITDQIMLTRAKIYEVTGFDSHIMRPPYGSFNDTVKAVGALLGVSFIHWSVDPMDWKTKNADAVYNEIMRTAKDGAIVLCHDLHKSTVDAMELVIPQLIAEGYQLVTVSELMEYSGIDIEAGNVYFKA
ncbi:MAG: polysaccharide deacetylase family protein, partial [Clostridia bacterium]|nr:polysaccharide deacetylase family protein [Clostridia bacterium]